VELLEIVRIPDAKSRLDSYPYEMSGGMRQRVMFAIAIACRPKLLVADEPTTALDVTIQNQILKLIRSLRDQTNTSIVLITHDLGVVAETCERVIVMYGGKIMEEGLVDEIFYETAHQYTIGLKKSIPDINRVGGDRLFSIPGSPPSLINPPKGCPFCARCDQAMRVCAEFCPPYFQLSPTHRSMCWLLDPERPSQVRKGWDQ
jgi:oligopeptide transport system ATP-binding protein